jgi:beta-lactamase superfamily II metal-dependent hydrolase
MMWHRPSRSRLLATAAALTLAASPGTSQGNGRLQLHFINVGQGDAALLVSPGGETVLFDNGVLNNCDLPVSYLSGLGIRSLDYHVASHYHSDHIGCSTEVFGTFPVTKAAYDRGADYETVTYARYVARVGSLRRTAAPGETLRLDSGSANPVTITFQVVNGVTAGGRQIPARNENDLSVVVVVRFGEFDAVIGGDLSGERTSSYNDIETAAAAEFGKVELYKVNHHGSSHSSNDAWLARLRPLVGIVSAGVGNSHDHPKPDALARLHDVGTRTYWTTAGAGEAVPVSGRDVVGGNILVEVEPGAVQFSVAYDGARLDTHRMHDIPVGAVAPLAFAWSTKSDLYHHWDCLFVANIRPENLARGAVAPTGKRLHDDCPKRRSQ